MAFGWMRSVTRRAVYMFTTAGAARSTASAYELTACGAVTVIAGWAVEGEAFGEAAAAGDAGAGAGLRLATSSGRTMTAMNAAASPMIADAEMKVRNRKTGRVDMSRIFLAGDGRKPLIACV